MSLTLLEAALDAAKRNWFVLPIYPALPGGVCSCPKGTNCTATGKHPLTDLVPRGQNDATTNQGVIHNWWGQRPDASVAVVLMPSGLLALDVDIYHQDDAKLKKLIIEHGDLPDTIQQNSGSGEGIHLIFRSPGIPVRGAIGGITVRFHNYIVISPSPHKSGGKYNWETGFTPNDIEPAHLPHKWVIALSRETGSFASVSIPTPESESACTCPNGVHIDNPSLLKPGNRCSRWLSLISSAERVRLMQEHLAKEEGEVMGQDNGKMFNVARNAARGFAIRDPNVVFEALKAYNLKCVPPYPIEKLEDKVHAAYEKCYSPTWGEALQLGVVQEQTKPVIPTPTEDALLAGFKAAIRRLTNSKKAEEQHTHDALDRVVKYKLGKPPVTDGNEVLFVIEALVKEAIPGAEATQLALMLHGLIHDPLTGGEMPVETLIGLVDGARKRVRPNEAKIPTTDAEVRGALKTNKEDVPKPTGKNIEKILRFSEALKDKIKWNVMEREIEVEGDEFSDDAKNGQLDTAFANLLEERWGMETSEEKVSKQLIRVAMKWGSYDPVNDYLDGLVWDGKERIDTWLSVYCKVEDSDYTRKVGARWLISGAARGLKPGCKVDTVLILKGEQGRRKSMVFDILGGEWFSDSQLDLANKDSRISAASTWIIELPELAALGQRDLESNKAFLSARRDKVRPPYGRADIRYERHCIFGATTNAEEFLFDETGNRRFWVAKVLDESDTDALRRDRDQLWAEAVVRYRAGERWWFEGKEQRMADKEAKKSTVTDAWVDVLNQWADRQNTLTSSALGLPSPSTQNAWHFADIAKNALGIEPADLQRHNKQLAKALREAGFEKKRSREGAGKRPVLWHRVKNEEDEQVYS